MTTTPPEAPQQPPGPNSSNGPRVTGDEMRDLTRLRRSSTDKHVAGVAGGLGRHLDIDPIILRVAFVVLAFFGGAGVLAYGALWLLVPDDEDKVVVDLDNRTRNIALVGVGVLAALLTVGDAFGGSDWFPWPILIIGVIAWLLISRRDRRRERLERGGDWVAPPGTPAGTAPTGAGAGGTTEPTRWAGGSSSMTGWAGAPTTYAAPGQAPPGYTPPGYGSAYVPPRRPRDPRKTGPILFWFTLALIFLAEGFIGTLDLAGVPIIDSAYPALALGITALMLLVGAFYGRAGGLILLGLLATVATTGATVASQVDGGQMDERPTSAAAVQDEYSLDTGEVIVDLSDVRDVEALDGRSIEVHTGIGRVEVILPKGVDVTVDGRVEGPGHLALLGRDEGGVGLEDHVTLDGGEDVPQLDLEAWVGIGEVEVTPGMSDPTNDPTNDPTTDEAAIPMDSTTTYDATEALTPEPAPAEPPSGRHPVNIGHLVMGLAFAGLVVIWALIEGDVIADSDIRWLLPIPWVLAGTAGLLAVTLGNRRRRNP